MSIEFSQVVLVGAGGHSRVVYDALRAHNGALSIDVRDDNPDLSGRRFFESRINVPAFADSVVSVPVHVAIGDNATRRRVAERFAGRGCRLLTIVHSASSVSRYAQIADGAFVAAKAVVGPGVVVGKGAIVNHGAVIDHDCAVAPWAHIAPNATLGGEVKVGEGALVGAGAVVLPGLEIEEWATVGAGAVVTRKVRANSVVVGVPAKRSSP